jgi:hypothetical protein
VKLFLMRSCYSGASFVIAFERQSQQAGVDIATQAIGADPQRSAGNHRWRGRRGAGILPVMSRPAPVGPASPAPLREFRCSTCGYGAARRSAPHRCPMCGSINWQEEGWKPFAALLDDFAASIDEAANEDASAPLQREAWEMDAASIFPGIPFH